MPSTSDIYGDIWKGITRSSSEVGGKKMSTSVIAAPAAATAPFTSTSYATTLPKWTTPGPGTKILAIRVVSVKEILVGWDTDKRGEK
jgi:hypothetical protein